VGCAEPLFCVPQLPRGYCASRCGVGHSACDGTCVDTRDGELCAKTCVADRECRVDEGYVCDPHWHACLVPNFAAIAAPQCPTKSPPRDTAFATSAMISGTVPGVAQRSPTVVIAGDGDAITAYTTSTPDGGGAIAITRIDPAGARMTDLPFAPGAPQLDIRLARGKAGIIYAAWQSADDQGNQISLAHSTDRGATWSAPIAAHGPTDCTDDPRTCPTRPLVATAKDIIYVLYAAGPNGLRVRASRDGAKSFATSTGVLTGIHADAVATSDGRLHVVALTGAAVGAYGSAMQRLEYTLSADGGTTFATPITISAPDEMLPFFFSGPSLAVDVARRWIYVAYVRGGRDARWEIVIAASRDNGATWKRTQVAGDSCSLHMLPALAVDPTTGTLHVAYYDSEGAPGRFVHASCGPGVTKCKVHGAINSTPFTTLSLGRNSSKWVGDYAGLAFDSTRRVLHATWAQTIDENGQPITRIFHAAAKLKK
jgi:hypothetical protein